ncbi:DUF5994 family protein [Streptomyces sp. C10-9-1]|uniref:DUF5994 family protein n=1 Tax=Streptomyces sp. C10-9-1 TaxID=1859285 RepID=UPI0021123785|nr:DUF5994 family protein [Streptomyces sp. C10-9-1]MCQ6552205.1 DUF5994 family protein [Streptomyces sp. C10-9-1]
MTSTTAPTRQACPALTPNTSLLLAGRGLVAVLARPHRRPPTLVGALEERWGRITRITADPAPWPVASCKVSVGGYTVHVGWLTDQDRDTMTLLSHTLGLGRCDLLVVPPEAEAACAARLMAVASGPATFTPPTPSCPTERDRPPCAGDPRQ